MVQNVSVSVNLCGMCSSHLIRKNYSEFIVTKFQIFDVKLLQMVTKTLFSKINKKLIVSFLIQWYSVFKISYGK